MANNNLKNLVANLTDLCTSDQSVILRTRLSTSCIFNAVKICLDYDYMITIDDLDKDRDEYIITLKPINKKTF